jgi:hypothetical protein
MIREEGDWTFHVWDEDRPETEERAEYLNGVLYARRALRAAGNLQVHQIRSV